MIRVLVGHLLDGEQRGFIVSDIACLAVTPRLRLVNHRITDAPGPL